MSTIATKRQASYGMLTRDNIKDVADRLRQMFDGKTFAIASSEYADSGHADVRLITDCQLEAGWTRETITRHSISPDEPILVVCNEQYVSISFSAGHYFWSLFGDADGNGYEPSGERKQDGTYFAFDRDSFRFEFVAPAGKGCRHKHLFKIQGE